MLPTIQIDDPILQKYPNLTIKDATTEVQGQPSETSSNRVTVIKKHSNYEESQKKNVLKARSLSLNLDKADSVSQDAS